MKVNESAGSPVWKYLVFVLIVGALFGLFRGSLAERTGWVYFALVVVALVPLALFFTNRRVAHLMGLGLLALLMGGVYLLDRYQETDREQVLRKTEEILRAVERADHAVFERHLASNFQWQGMNRRAMLQRARGSLQPSETRSCGISAAKVQGENGAPTLLVEGNLSANGQFGSQHGQFLGTIALTYTRQPDGQYQISGAKVAWHGGGGEVTLPP
jgi:hypothetical protein